MGRSARHGAAVLGAAASLLLPAPAGAETTVGGSVATDATWTKAGSPYLVVSDVVVQAGATLTVEPGVEVRVALPDQESHSRVIEVRGELVADGTPSEPIVFTSAGGRYHRDGWRGIRILGTGPATTFDHVDFSAMNRLEAEDRSVHVSHSRFANSGGLLLEGVQDSSVADSRFVRMTTGAVQLDGTGSLEVARNRLFESADVDVTAHGPLTADVLGNLFQNGAGLEFTSAVGGWELNVTANTFVDFRLFPDAAIETRVDSDQGSTFDATDNDILSPTRWHHGPTATDRPPVDLHAPDNWWGTTSAEEIDARILDGRDDPRRGFLHYQPVRTGPSPLAPDPELDAPDTVIDSGPPPVSRGAEFTFHAVGGGPDVRFECRTDPPDPHHTGFEPCQSPAGPLTSAGHGDTATFHVRAVGENGNVDPTPATWTWTYDLRTEVQISGGPEQGATVASREAAFTVSSPEEGVALECRLDAGDWASCSGEVSYSGLGDGPHRLEVRGTDPHGNTAQATREWTVEATPPEPIELLSPADGRRFPEPPVPLRWTRNRDAGSGIHRWEVHLNGEIHRTLSDCGDTCETDAFPLQAGTYQWFVRAYDRLGNFTDSVVRTFTIERAPTPPDAGTTGGGTTSGSGSGSPSDPGGADSAVGISIDGGARYTRDHRVTVTARWPSGATGMLFANDAGFAPAAALPLRAQTAWRLAPGGEGTTHTVYARFVGPTITSVQTHADDIVLDGTAPRLVAARLSRARPHRGARGAARRRGYVLRTRARDRVSGVGRLQVATNRRRPRAPVRYRRAVRVRSAAAGLWVRVIDRAGNRSRWRRARTPSP